jgi:hypothetical protein
MSYGYFVEDYPVVHKAGKPSQCFGLTKADLPILHLIADRSAFAVGGEMNRYLLSAIVVAAGLVLSIVLRLVMPSHTGLTFTSVKATHFISLSVICFWCAMICAVMIGLYLYMGPSITR